MREPVHHLANGYWAAYCAETNNFAVSFHDREEALTWLADQQAVAAKWLQQKKDGESRIDEAFAGMASDEKYQTETLKVAHESTSGLAARVEALEKADRLVKLALSLLRDVPPLAEYDWSEWITAAQLMGYDVGSTWEADEATVGAARKLLEGK